MGRAAESTKRPPEVLTGDQVRALIDACSGQSSAGIRLRALISMLYGCGLRIAEALALEPKDLDLEGREFDVLHGKNDKSRHLGMPAETALLVERWLVRRATYRMPKGSPIFCTYSIGSEGQPIHQQQVRTALFRAARRAGIERRVHPHGLRHSFAFAQAQAGIPMHVIQQELGHSSLAVTDRYVSHLRNDAATEAMRAWEW